MTIHLVRWLAIVVMYVVGCLAAYHYGLRTGRDQGQLVERRRWLMAYSGFKTPPIGDPDHGRRGD
jgi:hypothetical protein